MESSARSRSLGLAQGGWASAIASIALAGTGTALVIYDDDSGRRVVYTGMQLAGAVLGYLATNFLSREKDADDLAKSAAIAAANANDEEASNNCNTALAGWDSARSAADIGIVHALADAGGATGTTSGGDAGDASPAGDAGDASLEAPSVATTTPAAATPDGGAAPDGGKGAKRAPH